MYRVRWEQRALDELTSLWMHADSVQRHAITEASHRIDERLRKSPDSEGESRPKGRRIMFLPPLAVTFRIDADQRTVSVLEFRLLRRRKL